MNSMPSLNKRVCRSNKREKFLAEHLGVKEVVSRGIFSVTGLEKKVEELMEYQVAQLAEAIQ
jgi:hypothetical protein